MKLSGTLLLWICIVIHPYAQHNDWLPQGAVLYYANYAWFDSGPTTISAIEVVDALETDSSQIRHLYGGCGGCESFSIFEAYLERVENRVFYCTLSDSMRYLLYDFDAQPEDTVWFVGNLANAVPEYADYIVRYIDTIALFDTILELSRVVSSVGSYEYGGRIYDELGGQGCLLPQYGACDPQSGPLVAYRHPTKGLHCFDTLLCALVMGVADYSPFPDLASRFYQHEDGKIYGIGIEDVEISGDTVRYFPNKSVTDSLSYMLEDNSCYSSSGGWMFHHAEYRADGSIVFVAEHDELNMYMPGADELLIKSKAGIGDSWLATSSVNSSLESFELYAMVVGKEAIEVLGVIDTVKQIGFSSPQTAAFDDLYMLLGKTTGLVAAINYRQLPKYDQQYFANHYDQQSVLDLVGKDGYGPGIKNLTWLDVWNFQVGDILQIRDYSRPFYQSSFYIQQDVIWEILERDYISGQNGVSYLIDEQKRVTRFDSVYTIGLTRDTITQEYFARPSFDALPGTFIGADAFPAYYHQGRFLDRSTKVFLDVEYHQDGSCISEAIIDGCFSEYYYIEGLGGPYFYCEYDAIGGTYDLFIKYFKKGSEEWGVPFDFSVATEDVVHAYSGQIVFPNPARDHFFVSKTTAHLSHINILDITGVLKNSISVADPSTGIDVSTLPQGMYMIQLYDGDRLLQTSRFVIQR